MKCEMRIPTNATAAMDLQISGQRYKSNKCLRATHTGVRDTGNSKLKPNPHTMSNLGGRVFKAMGFLFLFLASLSYAASESTTGSNGTAKQPSRIDKIIELLNGLQTSTSENPDEDEYELLSYITSNDFSQFKDVAEAMSGSHLRTGQTFLSPDVASHKMLIQLLVRFLSQVMVWDSKGKSEAWQHLGKVFTLFAENIFFQQTKDRALSLAKCVLQPAELNSIKDGFSKDLEKANQTLRSDKLLAPYVEVNMTVLKDVKTLKNSEDWEMHMIWNRLVTWLDSISTVLDNLEMLSQRRCQLMSKKVMSLLEDPIKKCGMKKKNVIPKICAEFDSAESSKIESANRKFKTPQDKQEFTNPLKMELVAEQRELEHTHKINRFRQIAMDWRYAFCPSWDERKRRGTKSFSLKSFNPFGRLAEAIRKEKWEK